MKFENEFEVEAPVDAVWKTVLDVERIAPTVPGASVLEQTGESSYKVGIKVKLGPMTMQYKADVEIVEADESSHRAVMKARAREARGQGTADADVTMELSGDDGRTTGRIVTDMKVSGRAASMGRGVMQDVAGRMVGTFAENLAKMLEEGDAPEERAEEAAGSAAGAAAASGPSTTSGGGGSGDDAFDVGSLGASMAAERVKDPLVIALLVLAFLLGRRSAR
jgi:uncharacterized protein